ncbi:hypothetical protein Tco_0456166 [Tanacetum coccineum]
MEMEPDIENMTFEEYLRYESEKESQIKKSVRSKRRTTRYRNGNVDSLYRNWNEESDEDEIGVDNLKRLKQEEILNEGDNEKARDTDQENENMNVSTAKEKEEVNVENVEIDEDHKVDITKTKEALQWSLGEDPFLIFMELKDQSHFMQHIIPSSISKVVKSLVLCALYYSKGTTTRGKRNDITSSHSLYTWSGDRKHLATGKHFKSELLECHTNDDDELLEIMDVARG